MKEKQITAAVSAAVAAASQGYFSTAGTLLGPPQEAWLPAHPLAECGWSSTLDKQQFHFFPLSGIPLERTGWDNLY